MAEITRRIRINVGHTASGKTTWDCTVELACDAPDDAPVYGGQLRNMSLAESDALVAELEGRYEGNA
jgi:hypothetical protein